MDDWAVEAALDGAMERERGEWRRAAFVAHQSGGMMWAKKPPSLDKMMGQFDPRPDVSAAQIRAVLEAAGGVTSGG
ncbi:MAG: hypothetical protein ACRCT6_05190 [Notoacmeibacter sp.]